MSIVSHLAESTVFAAIIALATLAFRRNHARTRHWLWMSASLKFLVPFSLLVATGSQVAVRTAPVVPPPQLTFVLADTSLPAEPFTPPLVRAQPHWTARALWALWLCGAVGILLRWSVGWRRVAAMRRVLRPLDHPELRLASSPCAIEPGVVGIFRPVVVVPDGLADRLSPEQWAGVLAHEGCHIRRRDNLAAAIHMLVEALFWFHPLVWWIGARLVEERERACDEEVLRLGGDPESYAESILEVCRFCLEQPLVCVSGITGADLEKRIETIVSRRGMSPLGSAKKWLLAALAIAAVAGPVAIGLAHAASGRAQSQTAAPLSFEVASVKQVDPNKPAPGFILTPTRSGGSIHWVANRVLLIRYAFRLQGWRISGIEMGDGDYIIDAKTDPAATEDQVRLMFQTLLAERFKLVVHRETRELNGYALTVAKNGPKIKPVADGEKAPPMPDYLGGKDSTAFEGQSLLTVEGKGVLALTGRRVTMAQLAETMQSSLSAFVLDKTDLPGKFYVGFRFGRQDAESDLPPLSAMLRTELGLRLEKQKGPVETLIVDRIETAPVEN